MIDAGTMSVVDTAFAWGFGVVFGIGFAIWLLDMFFGVNLLAPFCRHGEEE
jgi:hypothetical protein